MNRTTVLIHLLAVVIGLAIYAPEIRNWYILNFTDRIAFSAPMPLVHCHAQGGVERKGVCTKR